METPTLRHMPALDGLRGCAVAAVVLFHGGYLTGGYLGVDLFFVLSGFLITSLLLAESTASGSVSLGHFWSRRARRLLPALAGVLAGVALYCVVWADPTQLQQIRSDAFATIAYVANWHAVFTKQDYWSLFTSPSPLQHTWSLAIEEQFYLVWPLVFVGLLSIWKRILPKAVLITSLVLAAIAHVLTVVLYNPANVSRVYYGTDTRASGILLGAAFAAWLALRGPVEGSDARRALEIAGVFGVWVVAVAWTQLDGQASTLYRGGLLASQVAVVAIIAAAVHPTPGPIARVLSFRPLCLLGLISYGVYLWHWPVDVVLDEQRTHLHGVLLFLVQCAVTLAIATLSYHLLERPIRRGAISARQWRRLTPAVATVLVLSLAFSTLGAKAQAGASPSVDAAIAAATRHPHATRVMVVGNSVGWYLADTFKHMRRKDRVIFLNAAVPGCFFPHDVRAMRFRTPFGGPLSVLRWPACDLYWAQQAAKFHPQVVVWIQADPAQNNNDVAVKVHGAWMQPCSPEWNENEKHGIEEEIRSLTGSGARLAIATAAYPRLLGQNGDRATDCENRIRREVAATTRAQVIDLFTRVCPNGQCIKTENGVTLRPDGLHFKDRGGEVIGAWLLDQLHL